MRTAAAVLLVFLTALAATIALQVHGGAYAAEFNETSDESAHYVTGLLVHDYVAAGMPRTVKAFFKQFRDYYSNVGIGHWPPGFYLLQAAWTLPFGASRDSLLLMMAALNAGFVTASFFLIRSALSLRYALGAALLLLTLPLAQVSARSVMGEVPMALLVLGAVASFRSYLKRERALFATTFGLLAAAALLTKGTGILLAPIPPLGALLQRRFGLIARWHFWLPAGLVAALCVPWYLTAPGALHERVALFGGLIFQPERVPETFLYCKDNLGWPVLVAALVGFMANMRAILAGEDRDPVWPLALVVVAGSVVLRAVVGAWEARHLLTAMPWMLLFAAGVVRRIVARSGLAAAAMAGVSVIVVAAQPAWNIWSTPPKLHLGLDEAALSILATPGMEASALLVISDLTGEGAFTAEIAGHERRPGHPVLRGSQVLAHTSFLGDEYVPRFRDAASLMRYLRTMRPIAVILDDPAQPFPHAKLVRQAIAENAAEWRMAGAHAGPRAPIEIWRLE